MLLMSPSEAALGIGAKCGGSSPADDDPQMVRILRYITPRIEGALNVKSIQRKTWRDSFYVPSMPCNTAGRVELSLLLSNGFVLPSNVVITMPSGTTITGAEASACLQAELGVVKLESWTRGIVTVDYESGFEVPADPDPLPTPAPDPEDKVLLGVPDWMKGIATQLLIVWYRTSVLNPKFPKEISFGQVDSLLKRELYARVYEKYMRPRVGMIFSDRLDDGA